MRDHVVGDLCMLHFDVGKDNEVGLCLFLILLSKGHFRSHKIKCLKVPNIQLSKKRLKNS